MCKYHSPSSFGVIPWLRGMFQTNQLISCSSSVVICPIAESHDFDICICKFSKLKCSSLAVHRLIFNVFLFYKEHIPLISTLCNPGIRARHWLQMTEIFGEDLTPDAGTTLRKTLKKNLGPHMDEFESISGAASKVSGKLGGRIYMNLCTWIRFNCYTMLNYREISPQK